MEIINPTNVNLATDNIATSSDIIVYDRAILHDIRSCIMKAHVDAQTIKETMLIYMMQMAMAEINNIIELGQE